MAFSPTPMEFSYQIKPNFTHIKYPSSWILGNIQPGTTSRTKKLINNFSLQKIASCTFSMAFRPLKLTIWLSQSSVVYSTLVETGWFFGWKRREQLQGCNTSSCLIFWGSGNQNPPCVHGQKHSGNEPISSLKLVTLDMFKLKKKTHYTNEPPPLNKPKTPPWNKEKSHVFILSNSWFLCFTPTKNHLQPTFNRPSSAVVSLFGVPAGRMAERGLGGGSGVKFWVRNILKRKDSKILPKMDDLVVIYDDLHWFNDLAMIKWGMISDGRQILEHQLEQMQGNWVTVAHLIDSLFWWHLFWEAFKRGDTSNSQTGFWRNIHDFDAEGTEDTHIGRWNMSGPIWKDIPFPKASF